MLFSYCAAATALAGVASAQLPTINTATGTSDIAAAQATAKTSSSTSNVEGKAFDRFVVIWLENTDYTDAFNDPSLASLAKQGILLTNKYAVTHPSEPNYVASVGGDYFGMDNDNFNALPQNVSTVVDLLEDKWISWASYQEDLPYTGFEGFQYLNAAGKNDYVRKHDPLIIYNSVENNPSRVSNIKNFTQFYKDLEADKLPQWMWITSNMTDDGHDTNVTFESRWARSWLTPLMQNTYFMNNTLILLTFDEIETYTTGNRPFAILLGGAIPEDLKGTQDDTFYNHYSAISTVSMNWGLPSLGRWDCEANIFALVANKTGYKNEGVNTTGLFFNMSYPGPLSDAAYIPTWPNPATSAKCASGMGVLPAVQNTFQGTTPTYNYSNPYPYSEAAGINTGGSSQSASSASATASAKSGATVINIASSAWLGLILAAVVVKSFY